MALQIFVFISNRHSMDPTWNLYQKPRTLWNTHFILNCRATFLLPVISAGKTLCRSCRLYSGLTWNPRFCCRSQITLPCSKSIQKLWTIWTCQCVINDSPDLQNHLEHWHILKEMISLRQIKKEPVVLGWTNILPLQQDKCAAWVFSVVVLSCWWWYSRPLQILRPVLSIRVAFFPLKKLWAHHISSLSLFLISLLQLILLWSSTDGWY